MPEPLKLKTELRTQIRGMKCADYVVSLVYQHLLRVYSIRAECRSAEKSAYRRWHKSADRRKGGRGALSDCSFTKQINHSGAE